MAWLLRKPPLPCHRGGNHLAGWGGGVGVPAHIYICMYGPGNSKNVTENLHKENHRSMVNQRYAWVKRSCQASSYTRQRRADSLRTNPYRDRYRWKLMAGICRTDSWIGQDGKMLDMAGRVDSPVSDRSDRSNKSDSRCLLNMVEPCWIMLNRSAHGMQWLLPKTTMKPAEISQKPTKVRIGRPHDAPGLYTL